MIAITYKTIKPSNLEKFQIMQNIKKPMFQVTSYFLTEF